MRNVRQPCGGHVLVVRIAIERSRSGAASKSRLNVNTAEAAIDAAIAGIGNPRPVLSGRPSHQRGQTPDRSDGLRPEPMPVHLVHAGQGLLLLKIRSFLEYAAPR
jgi:hypothetical protein